MIDAPPISEPEPRGFLRHCYLVTRGEVLFHATDVTVHAMLNGYAVLPVEEFARVKAAAGEPIDVADLLVRAGVPVVAL